ncbi:hypothetical protein KKD80_02690 [Patescibacteria group bacterium]|nr:hypothetical protein [Patescibacteria group bacterium]
MSSKTALVLATIFALLSAASLAIGMCRLKLKEPDVAPFVIGFFVLLALAICFAWREKKKRGEESRDLH